MQHSGKRYHINYSFFDAPIMCGAVNVYQICDVACRGGNEVANHYQHCHEISLVAAGEGVFTRNEEHYRLREGSLFVVSQGDMHSIYSSRHDPLRYLCIAFTFNRAHGDFAKYEQLASFYENTEQSVAQDLYDSYHLLSGAIGEISSLKELGEEMFGAFVRQILISTYRSFAGEKRVNLREFIPHNNVNPLIYEMTRYIDENPDKPLGAMGDALGYNYSYLSRLFSTNMGSTLRQYYDRRRFERAEQLLEEAHPLSVIAEKLGFADTPTFCKAFKKYFKCSPGEYRKERK